MEQSIISKAIIRANTHYYRYDDAIELINICQQNNRSILGIDSFIVTETRTQPFMEHSVDFTSSSPAIHSMIANPEDSYDLAREFLKTKQNYGFVFEIVY